MSPKSLLVLKAVAIVYGAYVGLIAVFSEDVVSMRKNSYAEDQVELFLRASDNNQLYSDALAKCVAGRAFERAHVGNIAVNTATFGLIGDVPEHTNRDEVDCQPQAIAGATARGLRNAFDTLFYQ